MAYKSIVCGVTGSEGSAKAQAEAVRLAKEDGAALTFVYAVDATFLKGITIGIRPEYAEKTLEHLGGHILEDAESMAKGQGVVPKLVLAKGAVLNVLKQTVAREKADLLVLGDDGRTFFEKVLFGGEVGDHAAALGGETGVQVLVVK